MKKGESVLVRADDAVSRESVYKFFSGKQFYVSEQQRIEAKVTMRTDQHDPDFFQDIIVNIQLYDNHGSKRRCDLGSVVISLDLLLTHFSEDITPSIKKYVRKKTEIDSQIISNELTKISMVIKANVEAFVRLGTESPVVAEMKERKEVREFLSGKALHRVAGFLVTVQMTVNHYNYEDFKNKLIIIDVMRPDMSLVGFVITEAGRIYSFGIHTQLDALAIKGEEANNIEDHVRHLLLRFEALGPTPVITSYDATAPLNDGPEALHSLVTEFERVVDEWEAMTIHLSTIVSTLSEYPLAKYRNADNPNQEDLKKLIQLSKRVVSHAEKTFYTDPFDTNHS